MTRSFNLSRWMSSSLGSTDGSDDVPVMRALAPFHDPDGAWAFAHQLEIEVGKRRIAEFAGAALDDQVVAIFQNLFRDLDERYPLQHVLSAVNPMGPDWFRQPAEPLEMMSQDRRFRFIVANRSRQTAEHPGQFTGLEIDRIDQDDRGVIRLRQPDGTLDHVRIVSLFVADHEYVPKAFHGIHLFLITCRVRPRRGLFAKTRALDQNVAAHHSIFNLSKYKF